VIETKTLFKFLLNYEMRVCYEQIFPLKLEFYTRLMRHAVRIRIPAESVTDLD